MPMPCRLAEVRARTSTCGANGAASDARPRYHQIDLSAYDSND